MGIDNCDKIVVVEINFNQRQITVWHIHVSKPQMGLWSGCRRPKLTLNKSSFMFFCLFRYLCYFFMFFLKKILIWGFFYDCCSRSRLQNLQFLVSASAESWQWKVHSNTLKSLCSKSNNSDLRILTSWLNTKKIFSNWICIFVQSYFFNS